MTAPVELLRFFLAGYSHGTQRGKLFDPVYYWTPEQKAEYRAGFIAGRNTELPYIPRKKRANFRRPVR